MCWSRVEYPESRLVVLVVLGVRTDSIYGFSRTNPSIHYIDYRTRVQPGERGGGGVQQGNSNHKRGIVEGVPLGEG